jgi:hypothetical protein
MALALALDLAVVLVAVMVRFGCGGGAVVAVVAMAAGLVTRLAPVQAVAVRLVIPMAVTFMGQHHHQ